MKQITKEFTLKLGNDFLVSFDIQNDKINVFPTFSLFSIGKEKTLDSFICFKKENSTSLFNFKSKITTNFNIRLFEESYGTSKVLRVISVFNKESYFYATDDTYTIFYNPETNIKVRKTIEGSTTKYTFINSNEDEITYTKALFGGAISAPVEYKYKNSIKYLIDGNEATSSLNDNSFNGPRVDFTKNDDGSINEVRVYAVKYDNTLTENKYKKINFTYDGDYISKIIVTEFNGKIDTYNLSLNNANQWRIEHLESNKYVLFNFDSNGNLLNYLFDDIGSTNSSYIISFNNESDYVEVRRNNDFSCCCFDENGNVSYEFDNFGNIKYFEYLIYKKDYFKEKNSNNHNLRFNKISTNNLLVGNFSDQILGNWSFNSGGTGTYSFITSTLGNNYDVFTNGYGTKVNVRQGSSTSYFKTSLNDILSNRKFIFSGFYKSLVMGSSPSFSIIFTAKNKGINTGETIVFDLDTSTINKTKFFMKEVCFKKDVDQVDIQIEFYRGSQIEIYNFSMLEEIFGTINFYNENGILYKSIDGFNVSRTKIHEGHIKELSFYNKNIKIDDEIEENNEITKTIYSSQNVKNITKINQNNGFLKSKETIYGNNIQKQKEEFTYSDNGLLLSKEDSLGNNTEYSYYLNTDLYTKIESLIEYSFVYNGSGIKTVINSSNASPYINEYIPNFSAKTIQIKENNQTLYTGQKNYEDSIVYFKYNNIYFVQNSYVKGNTSSDKYISHTSLNSNKFNYILEYNEDDLLTSITHNNSLIFTFEYDTLQLLKMVSMNELSKYYSFSYDESGDLKVISTLESNVIAYKEKGQINYTKQSFSNGFSLLNFKQEYQNRNAVILNDLITSLKENTYYVCFFDSLINPNATAEPYKYLNLINNYYEKDDFIAFDGYFNEEGPCYEVKDNLQCLRLTNFNYIAFTKPHVINNSKLAGNIGFAYKIESMMIGTTNLITFNVCNYFVRLYYDNRSSKTLNLLVSYNGTVKINRSFSLIYDPNKFNFINIGYQCTNSYFKINLYGTDIYYSNKVNNSSSISNCSVTYNIFEAEFDQTQSSNNIFYLSGVIFNNKAIPFEEVIEHFNTLSKIISLSNVYKDNFSYCPNGKGSINYLNPSNQFTWIPLKDSLKDSNNKYPITNFGYKNPFIFHLMTLGNCYYAHHNKLIYRTDLKEKGALFLKTKLFKIAAEQPYFSLINDKIQIKLFVDDTCNIKLKVNGITRTIYSKTEIVLTHEHSIIFSYSIVGGVLYYNVQFSSNTASSGNISLGLTEIGENFELYLGCSNEIKEYEDFDGNVTVVPKDTYDGLFSDVLYTNKLDSLLYNNSLLSSYKNPIISDLFDDVFGREYQKRIVYQNKMIVNEKYDYLEKNGNQTPLISKEKILLNTTSDNHGSALNRSVSYLYDAMNRIVKIIEYVDENGSDFYEKVEYSYTYNSNSFLTKAIILKTKKENGSIVTVFSNQYIYEYNSNGDLVRKEETENNYTVSKNLTYGSNIKHQLTKIADKNFVYEGLFLKAIKNNSDVVTETFGYRGTKLTSYYSAVNNVNLNFYYDHEGKRILKHNLITNEKIHYYYDLDGKLIREKHNSYYLNFIYDAKGRLFSLIYQTGSTKIPYFYIRNALNDISEIVDSNGNCVAKYIYNPFGKIIGTTGSNVNNIANINPFRYRGYYYDSESQLFYCNSRYYSPELCRWISPDSIEYLDDESINGLNLYAYCGNDPVNRIDPTGHSWESFWNAVEDWFSEHWVELVIGTAFIIGGAIVTALTCGGGTTAWAAFGSALLSSAIQVGAGIGTGVLLNGVSNLIQGNDFFDNVGDTIASTYMLGGILSGGSQMLSGGFRFLRAKTGFKGIDSKNFGFMSADKLYHDIPGMTALRLGSRNGAKLAIDFGKYGIHGHIWKWSAHIPLIPGIVGIGELF